MEVNSLKFPLLKIFDDTPQLLQNTRTLVSNILFVLAEQLFQDIFIILDTGQIFLSFVVFEEEQNGQILKIFFCQFCNFKSDSSLTFSLTSLISQPASAQLRAIFQDLKIKLVKGLYYIGQVLLSSTPRLTHCML